jgi:hypothetical protein
MRLILLFTVTVSALFVSLSSHAAERILTFPKSASREFKHIDKQIIRVACGRISSLRNIPALYDIKMGYDIPSENIFEARPRLGAAAVDLVRWDGVIGVLSESNKCFAVRVEAMDMDGNNRKMSGKQLGLTK